MKTEMLADLINSVWKLFDKGSAPSEIDELFNIPPGIAHDCVVTYWAEDMQANAARSGNFASHHGRRRS